MATWAKWASNISARLPRSLGLLSPLLRKGLGLGDGILQYCDISFQSLDPLGCQSGFLALLFAESFDGGDSILQRSDLSLQYLNPTALVPI
jgi:hypothetical protein